MDGFSVSPESQSLYGLGNPESFVTHIYQSVLGRQPDPDGLIYWSLRIYTGSITKAAAALTIASTAANNGTDDSKVFANKVDAATSFTKNIDTGNEYVAYSGSAANEIARTMLSTITLTPATPATVTNTLNSVVNLAFPPAVTPDPPAPDMSSDTGPWTPPPPGDPFWGPV